MQKALGSRSHLPHGRNPCRPLQEKMVYFMRSILGKSGVIGGQTTDGGSKEALRKRDDNKHGHVLLTVIPSWPWLALH